MEGQSRRLCVQMRRAEALEALLEAANEQGGYVSGPQAKRLGVGHKDINRLVAAGDLQRARRGVYRMRHAQSRFEDEVAAWLHLQRDRLPWERHDEPRAVLSHESAAGFHRLGTIIPGRPTFTALHGSRTTTADDLVLHHMRLPDEDWTWERDETLRLPITTQARTIVDLMLAHEEPSYIVRAAREALARGETTPAKLRDTARRRKSKSRAIERRVERLLEEIT
jgi:predicted transcriptional regulator of viral defense system